MALSSQGTKKKVCYYYDGEKRCCDRGYFKVFALYKCEKGQGTSIEGYKPPVGPLELSSTADLALAQR